MRFEKLRKERRIVAVPVDVEMFADLIQKGVSHTLTSEGIPHDAIFVTVAEDLQSQVFNFLYLHESFEPVPEGVRPPLVNVTMTRHDKPGGIR